MAKLDVKSTAPDFSLKDEHGETVSLSDLRGRRVVVYFYPADDTPGCTKEACQFSEQHDGFASKGVEVIGISADDAASHRAFREKYGLSVVLLSDPGHEVAAKYGAYGEKTLYGKKTIGVIRSTFLIGPDGLIERTWYQVRADGHAEKVLGSLRS